MQVRNHSFNTFVKDGSFKIEVNGKDYMIHVTHYVNSIYSESVQFD